MTEDQLSRNFLQIYAYIHFTICRYWSLNHKNLNQGPPIVLWQRATPVTVAWLSRMLPAGHWLKTHDLNAAHGATVFSKICFNTVLPSTPIFSRPLRVSGFSTYFSVIVSPPFALRFTYFILFSLCNTVHLILTLRIITKIPILIDNKPLTQACVLDIL